jgi:hypothetical protein
MAEGPANTEGMSSINNTTPEFRGIPIPREYLPSLTSDQKVLDIGSGPKDSKLLTELLSNATSPPKVVKLDYFKENLDQTEGPRIQANATQLPLEADTVDAVVTSELTPDNPYFKPSTYGEKSENKKRLLSEIQRVVKIGGHWMAYNEDIHTFSDGLPPGFVPTFQYLTSVDIIPYRLRSYPLSFGVFEKVAEEVPQSLIGQNIASDRNGYQDNFTRALTQDYPPTRTLGQEVISQIKSSRSEQQTIEQLKATFPYIDDEAAQVFIRAATTGNWTADLITVNTPNISQYLEDLASPNGSWIAHSGKYDARYRDIHADSTQSKRIRNALQSHDYHVSVLNGSIRIVPTQKFFDQFLFLNTTDIVIIDSNPARVRKHQVTSI